MSLVDIKSVPYKYRVSSLISADSRISAGFSKAFSEVIRLLSLLIFEVHTSATSSPKRSCLALILSIYCLILSTFWAPDPVAIASKASSTSISQSSVVAFAAAAYGPATKLGSMPNRAALFMRLSYSVRVWVWPGSTLMGSISKTTSSSCSFAPAYSVLVSSGLVSTMRLLKL